MNEEKKGSKFKSLFFRDVETSQPQPQQQQNPGRASNTNPLGRKLPTGGGGIASPVSAQPLYTPPPVLVDNNLVDNFVQKLQDLINQNNQPGFDFLEFTETLFEESASPTPDVYKTVFRIAQKMDKSLTPDKLVQSASYYKSVVQQTADSEMSKGQSKKSSLQEQKESERKSLEKTLQETNDQIEKLNTQILSLQNQSNLTGNQLSAIDQKYSDQLADIDTKVNAINTAKEQVISSIVDVESGIKNNL